MENERIVNCAYLANFLNVTERRIQQLAKEEVLVKAARGEYNFMASIRGYIKFIQECAYGDRAIGTNLQATRARESKLRGDLLEIEYFQSTGQLVSVEDIEPMLMAWALQGRSEVVNAMNKIIGDIEGANDVLVDREMVGKYIESALNAIGDYPKSKAAADIQVNNKNGERNGY